MGWVILGISGKVPSNQSKHLAYAGQVLRSRVQCYWKVMVWDVFGEPSDWSAPVYWSMGLLEAGDWKAEWIGVDQSPDSKPAYRAAMQAKVSTSRTSRATSPATSSSTI